MWGLPTVSYHPAKFDSYRYCESADASFLNFSRDQVIKRSRDFEGRVLLLNLVPIGIADGQI